MASLPQQTLDALKKARAEGRNVDAANLQKVISRLTQAIDLGMKNQSAAAMPPPVASSFGTSSKPKDPDATDYHAIFPINDYPQKARWKATNKEQMTLLSEISGASITMRGVYYPPGEDPPMAGEPKLHLLIESNDEMKVRAAVEEIRRNLVEASVLALNVSRACLVLFNWLSVGYMLMYRTPIEVVQLVAGILSSQGMGVYSKVRSCRQSRSCRNRHVQ
jgi:ATP-dependent RNA helicase DDX46/PRP5